MAYKNYTENKRNIPIMAKYSRTLATMVIKNNLLKLYLVTPSANVSKGAGRGVTLKRNIP